MVTRKTVKWLGRFAGVFLIVGVLCVLGVWFMLPNLEGVKQQLSFTAYTAEKQKNIRTLIPETPEFVSSLHLPDHVVGAILVSEDSSFFQHQGIDWFELKESIKKNLKEGKYARGASTITQQLVKNAFLTREKTLSRKLIEAITTVQLERILNKRQILDYYLNLIEMGPGVYGIREGAQYYFQTNPENLTPYQAALIAFFIPSPQRYGQDYLSGKISKYRDKRVKTILKNMVIQQYVTLDVVQPYLSQIE